jgi:hypothetical protein
MTDVRLIDANSVCKKIVESIRCAEEWANEAREQQDIIGLQYASDTYSSLISMLERIQNEPTVEAITREQYHEMTERFFDEFIDNGADEETVAKCMFIGMAFGKLELMLFESEENKDE